MPLWLPQLASLLQLVRRRKAGWREGGRKRGKMASETCGLPGHKISDLVTAGLFTKSCLATSMVTMVRLDVWF